MRTILIAECSFFPDVGNRVEGIHVPILNGNDEEFRHSHKMTQNVTNGIINQINWRAIIMSEKCGKCIQNTQIKLALT